MIPPDPAGTDNRAIYHTIKNDGWHKILTVYTNTRKQL